MITAKQFQNAFPFCPANLRSVYLPLMVASMIEFQITTRERACAYFAQIGHESLDFKYMQEIASGREYEGRHDLGNTSPGDGVRFKGRAPLQITGKTNYARTGRVLNLPLVAHPELLEIPANGFRASALWWKEHGCNGLADALNGTGYTDDLLAFARITRRINGGTNGAGDRLGRYTRNLRTFDQTFSLS